MSLLSRMVWLSKPLVWLLIGLGYFCRFLIIAWGTLAIYYSNLPWAWARLAMAVAFAVFAVWALWPRGGTRRFISFVGVFLGVLVWWIFIPPSHDRPWRREVANMPRAIIDGDKIRITGVRNFEFRTRDDFTERYEEREVLLSHLTSMDFYVSYWKIGPVAHTFVSFNFDNAPPVCISIETRPEKGEGFNPISSLFKQFELIYVVGDERDLVKLRTHHRDEDVFLYRIRARPDDVRRLFTIYLNQINSLADQPVWYNLLSNSCTINIVRYANAAGRVGGFYWGHLLNGWIDRYLFHSGVVDTTLPFEELRRLSHINEAAKAAGDAPDFSERIRAGLPMPRP
jgi:hypothetical protein